MECFRMSLQEVYQEAEICRRRAAHFEDKAEGAFLLRLASAFDEIAASRRAPAGPVSAASRP
jgi:hypothetical protein